MYDIIPKEFLITDKRLPDEFKVKTFNGYKKTEIFNDLEKNILSGNIEKSLRSLQNYIVQVIYNK